MRQFRDGLILTNIEDTLHYFETFDPQRFRVICRFRDDAEWTQTEELLGLAKELKDLDLVVDEVDKICSPSYVSRNFYDIINYGRHDRINLYTSARRAAEVARTLTSNADEIVVFKTQEPADLDSLRARGFDPARLRSLGKFEYITNI